MISKNELIEIAEELGLTVDCKGDMVWIYCKPESPIWNANAEPHLMFEATYKPFEEPNLKFFKLISQTRTGYYLTMDSPIDKELPSEVIRNIAKKLIEEVKRLEYQHKLNEIKGDFDDR